jgi:acetoin utilization deacetylase AcuC-like enzyme/GNAT superfamily N-acetyltransferase
MAQCTSGYVYSHGYQRYDFGPNHPLQPQRLEALNTLLAQADMLNRPNVLAVKPAPATEAELLLAHDAHYLDTVRALSAVPDPTRAERAGLGLGDTPAFTGMHEAAALIAGGTLTAVRAVMRDDAAHAFNPGGGLHHAHRARASGFCIYNDLAVAIAAAVQEHGAKVLYLDFDVHHGDGVQAAFYDDPRVLTVSFHETGRYLFPGTGAVLELGERDGLGYSLNVPLTAFTQDDAWLGAVASLVPALADRFQPDLIVSQFGCDGHAWDGQAHFRLTTRAYAEAARIVHEAAHTHAHGRWVATGGGGYDPVRVVPRAWALVWAEMAGVAVPDRLPNAWQQQWRDHTAEPMPEMFIDPPEIVPEIPRRPAIERENAAIVARVREIALTPRLRQAYRPCGPWTPEIVAGLPEGITRRVETARGALYLRDRCPASVVARMRVATGMHAFARSSEREHALLERIAGQPENDLVIAHTPEGEIVGEVSLAPADGRWFGVDGLYEAAIEVAPDWRSAGLGETLLRFAFERPYVERLIVLAFGLSWHWDLAGSGISAFEYRDRLTRLFKTAGFEVYSTDDPEVLSAEANVLVARVGRETPHALYDEFSRRLRADEMWRGF